MFVTKEASKGKQKSNLKCNDKTAKYESLEQTIFRNLASSVLKILTSIFDSNTN